MYLQYTFRNLTLKWNFEHIWIFIPNFHYCLCLSKIWRTYLGTFLSIKLLKTNPQRKSSVQVRLIDKLDQLFVNNTHRHNSNITVKEDWLSISRCRLTNELDDVELSWLGLGYYANNQPLNSQQIDGGSCSKYGRQPTTKYWIFISPPTLYYAEFQNITWKKFIWAPLRLW